MAVRRALIWILDGCGSSDNAASVPRQEIVYASLGVVWKRGLYTSRQPLLPTLPTFLGTQ